MRNKNIIGIVVLGVVFIIGFNLLKQKVPKQDIGALSKLITKRNAEKMIGNNLELENQSIGSSSKNCDEKSDVCYADVLDKKDTKKEPLEENSSLSAKNIAQTEPETIKIELLFSPEPIEESIIYEVTQGDTLSSIAREFWTTIDLIKASNKLEGSIIKVGQRLKIINGEFKIIIDTSNNALSLFLNTKLVKTYPVGTAKYRNTPIGKFKIINKLVDPTWYAPSGGVYPYGDPKNIIGTRWMGIDEPGYGIHGTTEPESIGKYVSQGCVRMHNEDVEELFTIVPKGTTVTIIENKEG